MSSVFVAHIRSIREHKVGVGSLWVKAKFTGFFKGGFRVGREHRDVFMYHSKQLE